LSWLKRKSECPLDRQPLCAQWLVPDLEVRKRALMAGGADVQEEDCDEPIACTEMMTLEERVQVQRVLKEYVPRLLRAGEIEEDNEAQEEAQTLLDLMRNELAAILGPVRADRALRESADAPPTVFDSTNIDFEDEVDDNGNYILEELGEDRLKVALAHVDYLNLLHFAGMLPGFSCTRTTAPYKVWKLRRHYVVLFGVDEPHAGDGDHISDLQITFEPVPSSESGYKDLDQSLDYMCINGKFCARMTRMHQYTILCKENDYVAMITRQVGHPMKF